MRDIDEFLTRRVALEVASKEDCVLEAYLDSENVWTWGFGLTVASGHNPMRYRGRPSSMDRAVEVYIWALRRYAQQGMKALCLSPLRNGAWLRAYRAAAAARGIMSEWPSRTASAAQAATSITPDPVELAEVSP